MFKRLGLKGIVGVVLLLAGLGVIGYENPIIAAGMALSVLGIVLVLWGVVSNLLSNFGFGGMMP